MTPLSPANVGELFSSIARDGVDMERLRQVQDDRQALDDLLETVRSNPNFPDRYTMLSREEKENFTETVERALKELRADVQQGAVPEVSEVSDATIAQQKGWFHENLYSTPGDWGGGVLGTAGAALGTVGKIITLKPVEGIVNTLTFNKYPVLGKIARWAAVAAAGWYGLQWMATAEMQAANNFGNDIISAGNNLSPTPALSQPTNAVGVVGAGGAPNVISSASAPMAVPPPVSNPLVIPPNILPSGY